MFLAYASLDNPLNKGGTFKQFIKEITVIEDYNLSPLTLLVDSINAKELLIGQEKKFTQKSKRIIIY